jgi:hypothetical protein
MNADVVYSDTLSYLKIETAKGKKKEVKSSFNTPAAKAAQQDWSDGAGLDDLLSHLQFVKYRAGVRPGNICGRVR